MPSRRYLVFVRNVPGTREPPSPEQLAAMYAAFETWKEKFKANIVDMGGKLKPQGKVLTTTGITDGPFTEAKEVVGGYMVVSGDDFEDAIEVARGCPGIIGPATSVEIREIAPPG
jgi:hypothetical protein